MDAIVYESNAGHTAQYAGLLSASAGLPAYPLSESGALKMGASVVFMGWLMAGAIKGLKKARARFDVRAVCAVGMCAESEAQNADVKAKNALGETPFFYLQGGYEGDKLRGLYRFMMKTMEKTAGKGLADKPDRTPFEDDMLELLQRGGDRVSAQSLAAVERWLAEGRG